MNARSARKLSSCAIQRVLAILAPRKAIACECLPPNDQSNRLRLFANKESVGVTKRKGHRKSGLIEEFELSKFCYSTMLDTMPAPSKAIACDCLQAKNLLASPKEKATVKVA